VGPEIARVLIFREWAAIETTVLEKGRVEARSELQGEKKFGLKPPLDASAIAWSRELIAQGHIEGGDSTLLGSTSKFGRSRVRRVGVTHDR
jgi:hypothetical protein